MIFSVSSSSRSSRATASALTLRRGRVARIALGSATAAASLLLSLPLSLLTPATQARAQSIEGADSSIAAIKQPPAETIVHAFGGSSADGSAPQSALTEAADGTLYGTTNAGGTANDGIVYKIAPGATHESVLHNFGDGTAQTDGQAPAGSLAIGCDGTLYGTTGAGGASDNGTVFKITPGGKLTVLHSFAGGTDGGDPVAGVTIGNDGLLYGTTSSGGISSGNGGSGGGTVFSLRTDGTGYHIQFLFTDASPSEDGGQAECHAPSRAETQHRALRRQRRWAASTAPARSLRSRQAPAPTSAKITVLHNFGDEQRRKRRSRFRVPAACCSTRRAT